jgi:hypothetical protein
MIWYSDFILHPDLNYIALWSDGFKNYFTFAYYVNYDSGVHFSGMNYPFGEHIVFTDAQPVLAFVFKWLNHIPFVKDHLHAFFSLLTFVSVPLCAVVVFLLFTEFEVKGLHAILSAVLITLLSPQINKLSGHFGLSYCFIIPFAFLLLVRASKTVSAIYLFYYVLFVTLAGLTHIYHLAILTFFAVGYSTINFLLSDRNRAALIQLVQYLIAAVSPLVLVKLFMFLTDPITDRPENPWGFFESCSTYDTVFLAPTSFLYTWITHFVKMPEATPERWSYVGIVNDLTLLFFIYTVLFQFARVKSIFKTIPKPLCVAFISAILILLFAFGLPFILPGLKWTFDHTGPLKQFRAACRFAWMFYYIANIFGVVYVVRFLNTATISSKAKSILLSCYFLLWFIDMVIVNINVYKGMIDFSGPLNPEKEARDVQQLLADHHLSTHDFQALLYLPYFTNGSEKTVIPAYSCIFGMKVALYTGLKLIDAEMSRTSLSQVNLNAQLLSNYLIKKEVLNLYPSSLPILVAVDHERLLYNEQRLVDQSTYIGTVSIFKDSIHLYSMPLSAFNDSTESVRGRLTELMASDIDHGSYLSPDTQGRAVYYSYDSLSSPFTRFGTGALHREGKDIVLFDDTLPNGMGNNEWYEFSIWCYGDKRVPAYPLVFIEVTDGTGNVTKYELAGQRSTDIFEGWVRLGAGFPLPSSKSKVRILGYGAMATYDELNIRPTAYDVLTHVKEKDWFMYNNYYIKKP